MNSKKAVLTIGVAVLFLVGVIGLALLFAPPRLSFSIELDGKPLPADRTPVVKIDGQPFVSGSKLGVGQHAISVSLPNAEPFDRTVWLGFGNKSLGSLRLVSVTGAMNVSTYPNDCKVTLSQGGAVVAVSPAPAHFTKLLLGGYDLEVEKSGSKETSHIVVDETKPKDIEVKLKLGQLALSSVPADADYTLSGGGRNWDGHLPAMLQDVPAGNYELVVRRKSWEMLSELEVQLDRTYTNQTIFTYGTISILSDPAGRNILSNGVSIGKAPVMLDEVRPGKYAFSASDGENELLASITVEPHQQTNHLFTFRYGTIHLNSTPAGATLLRNGKVAGKTPLKLERIPAGETEVALKLDGYVTTNFPLHVVEGETVSLTAKLLSERYVSLLGDARLAAAASPPDYKRALEAIIQALQVTPDGVEAIQLQKDYDFGLKVSEATELLEKAGFDSALAKVDAALALKPDAADAVGLKSRITREKTAHNLSAVAKTDEDIAARVEASKRSFEEKTAKVAQMERGNLTDAVFITRTAAWRVHSTTAEVKEALLRITGRRVASEEQPAPDLTFIDLSPKPLLGIGDRNLFGQKVPSKDHHLVQLCQLPNNALDVRAKMIFGNTDRENAGAIRNAVENRFRTFATAFSTEFPAAIAKPSQPVATEIPAAQREQGAPGSDDPARKEIARIIEKAIAAVGGRDVLARFSAFKEVATTRGVNNGRNFAMKETIYFYGPNRAKFEEDVDGRHSTYSVDGDQVNMDQSGLAIPRKPSPGSETSLRNALYFTTCTSLLPLLDTSFRLELAPKLPPDAGPTTGIKVLKAGKPDLILLFDNASGLLVGMERDEQTTGGNSRHVSSRYSDFRNFSGRLFPTTIKRFRDGSLYSTETTESVTALAQP